MSSRSSTTSTTEYFSAINSDDEEFFDLPTDPESGQLTPTNDRINENGFMVEQALLKLEEELAEDQEERLFFRHVDELMEGQADDQKAAFDLLNAKKTEKVIGIYNLSEGLVNAHFYSYRNVPNTCGECASLCI